MIARGYFVAATAMILIVQSPSVWSQRVLTKVEREKLPQSLNGKLAVHVAIGYEGMGEV